MLVFMRSFLFNWSMNHRHSRGFTIVELLIVIVVIAILAAITIVAFNGVQQRARVATAQSELASMAKKLEMHRIDNGSYPSTSEDAIWKDYVVQVTGQLSRDKNYIICRNPNGAQYAFIAWNPIVAAVGEKFYFIDSKNGTVQTATWNGQGGFPFVSNAVCASVGFPVNGSSRWSNEL